MTDPFSLERLVELEGDAVPFVAAPRLVARDDRDPFVRVSTVRRVLVEAFETASRQVTTESPDAVTEALRKVLQQRIEERVSFEVQRATAQLTREVEQLKVLVRESREGRESILPSTPAPR